MNEEDINSTEDQINIEEIREAIKRLKNSSPGPDGIPSFIYKKFFVKISNLLLPYYNHVLSSGTNDDLSTARIRYIKKKDSDPKLAKSWRPISLIMHLTQCHMNG